MELKLPLLGDVMTEGTLVEWFQPTGAFVSEGSPLYRLETDKVHLTVDAPESGRLEQLVSEGETVPVGTVVGRLLETEPRVAAAEERAADDVRASPAARRLAKQLGVDLATIGTGRRIREADVQAFHHAHQSPVAPRKSPGVRGDQAAVSTPDGVPLAGRRKVIADRMRASLSQMAQLTISLEVDMTEAQRFRDQLKQLLPEPSRPTVTDLVIRAVVLALREHPALNATLEDGRLTEHAAVHVGLAVDAREGLIVPVVQHAEGLPLRDLAMRTRDLAERARANQLLPADLQGGTFTVTSLGTLGVDFFTPIVNRPQVAILGIGRIFSRLALVDGGRVEERQAMYLNLSFDHQALDGSPAARFLQTIKRLLELPAGLVI